MNNSIFKVETISDLLEIAGFDKPKHPLITIIDYSKVTTNNLPESGSYVCGFYTVNFKNNCSFLYGRQPFDHKEGTLHCTAPEQVITFDRKKEPGISEGWGLYFHPELLRNSALGNKISEYTFFSYDENEALHLSDHEKNTCFSILKQIEIEYNSEIAYELGFEYPQNFSKLFKKKVGLSPTLYRVG